MKQILIILILFISVLSSSATKYEGILITDTLYNSTIYPGTIHEYKIYIPKQYDASKPACLYLGLDGILYNAPAVIDSLITTGDIPIMIGVFLQPGIITDSDGNIIRYNRSNEFDRTDETFARFLETELLPVIKQHKLPDGKSIRISSDANDRSISGASSGGICAFVAAWFRPDMFSRVYTTCGTYVAMRGGNELPALVRKTAPQALRFYIHDGSNDAWNPLFGHWYEYNRLMASALEFAGYELKVKWDEGNHSIKNGAKLFPEALKYLWHGYPQQITAGKTQNNMLSSILIPEEKWEKTRYRFFKKTNIAIYPNKKHVTFPETNSDWLINAIKDDDGKLTHRQQFVWLHNPSHRQQSISGMFYDTGGNLYVATAIGIQICDHNGRVRAIIPYPTPYITAFYFKGNTLYVKNNTETYSLKINATAFNDSDAPINPPSQGQG